MTLRPQARRGGLAVLALKARPSEKTFGVNPEVNRPTGRINGARSLSVRDEPIHGETVQGKPAQDESVRDEPIHGETVQGKPVQGEPVGLRVMGLMKREDSRPSLNSGRKHLSHAGYWLSASLLIWSVVGCQSPPPGMVLVPKGEFYMGTDEVDTEQAALDFGFPRPWYEDEHPGLTIHLPAFYIDIVEVTNADYQQFIQATGRFPPLDWVGEAFAPERAQWPVVFVNWHEANEYCLWKGKRLPTEAEWEKAARGSTGQAYPWGNTFDPDKAHIAKGPVMFLSPVDVGSFEAGRSPYGAYNMIGNVWEWTDSWYAPYPGNQATNEEFGQTYRVNRGLSFLSIGHFSGEAYAQAAAVVARASFRSYDFPTSRVPDLGFRCAKSPD